jgi:ligand-binding sensor domain-containing protein
MRLCGDVLPYKEKMNHQQIKNKSSQIMDGFILMFAILLQLTCCNQEQSKPTQSKKSLEVDKKNTSLKLKFTSSIRSIFEDSKGNYWFGSTQEGVCLFNGKRFSYFTIENGLSNNQVLSIREDDNGLIWFGTQNGVSSFNRNKMTNHSQNIIMDLQHKWIKTEKDLWFNAGTKEGIYRYDGQRLNYLAFPTPKVINPYNVYSVTSLSKGKNNILWIGTYAGVFGYNGSDFTIINDETLGLDITTEPLHIRSLLEDSKGRLWIGNNGIGVLLKEGGTIINFSEKNNLIHPTSSRRGDKSLPGTLEHVFTITEDSQGNIWFGDRDTGVWKYDGKTMINYTKKDGLINDFAQSIYEDKNGELWFGMADGNIFKFNGKIFEKQF